MGDIPVGYFICTHNEPNEKLRERDGRIEKVREKRQREIGTNSLKCVLQFMKMHNCCSLTISPQNKKKAKCAELEFHWSGVGSDLHECIHSGKDGPHWK